MNYSISKEITIKLFFNKSDMSFYIQLNDMLFRVRDNIVAAIQNKEKLEIRHASSLKEIQQISSEDER